MGQILQVNDLHVYYGSIHAVKGVSFEVNEGEVVTLIGANGAGKSTVLNTVSGLLHPKHGSVVFEGKDLKGVPAHKIVEHGLAQVPEGRHVFLQMTVEDNLEMGAYTQPNSTIEAGIADVYERFPRLKERRKQIAGTLSGGEQQMLAMGRALMSKPKLLMLDEPSMGLAPILVEQIFDIIRELHAAGTTILLVEQNAQAALSVADRAYVLETGRPAPARSSWRATPSARPTSAVKSPSNVKSHPKGWLFFCAVLPPCKISAQPTAHLPKIWYTDGTSAVKTAAHRHRIGGIGLFKILIAEDDRELRQLFAHVLTKNGYTVLGVSNGEEALDALEQSYYDLIISDIMMPKMDGYELVRSIRESGSSIPIMMITAKDAFDDMRLGFLSGSDDYMVKPINIGEMVLRVSALLRRAQMASERRQVIGGTVMECDSLSVTVDGESMVLPQKEFMLLYKMASFPGRIFTRQQLMDDIWGYDSSTDTHTVDVHIARLRERFRDNPDFKIVTMRGVGYKVVRT